MTDVGYFITPDLNDSVGYCYQQGDLCQADGSGAEGRIAYNISDGLIIGANLSYDEAFEKRITADISYRFGSNAYTSPSTQAPQIMPTIQALTAIPRHRNVRVHDPIVRVAGSDCCGGDGHPPCEGCAGNGEGSYCCTDWAGFCTKCPPDACCGCVLDNTYYQGFKYLDDDGNCYGELLLATYYDLTKKPNSESPLQ